ncbi:MULTISPECIES: flagellar motor switch protein FliN [Variovorax]|jgi:flagellar motor switch protein FliN|uniref:flagellar motor switch protein FliN n=1 Tax=Variovorax TaxID=34072 RepID=UPI00086C944A|nr:MULTISPECIES: flagellar motor switch protein FliN [Variovorax]MBN8757163.1 flagellar motor switch protein FliN [Variovorax sp.]ODU17879.1 MAG: flagellar motor switch protein FliN [Variovorax sp. SCN 67-85]ODV24414.1 MAG: flagellar motor switch protein FliN [Variovorax sp. SCN 67-20]OJZ13648.1 MAG: flagellar motor switch protein FliN [Variovorax sp. 67-131]UKI06303.1 flagellar motor switch protein FliN [Variovorax paradoxus]
MTDNTSSASSDADDWAAALAEQTAATAPAPVPEPDPAAAAAVAAAVAPASAQVFQQIQDTPAANPGAGPVDIARVLDVPVQLTAEIGRTRITIKSLLQLSQGSVVELDGLAGQPLDVLINGYLIAQGEVVVVNEKYGIRLTDIVTPSERMQKLARS